MSKATEKKLSALHGAVAQVLSHQVTRVETETTFDEDGVEKETGKQFYSAPPATLAIAVKFLKDNDITCDIEVDRDMGKLKDILEKKTRHSRLGSGQTDAILSH